MKTLLLTFLAAGLFCGAFPYVVTVDMLYGNISEINAIQTEGQDYISATGLAAVLSGTHYWDLAKRKLMMHVKGADLVFTENNPYVLKGDSMLNFIFPPVIENGEMFVPLMRFIELLDPLVPERFIWEEGKKTLRIVSTESVIRHATCDERKNGTLYTLFLPDSMVFDYTFFKPQLNINVSKGRVSVPDIEMKNRIGLVDGVSAVQFAGNAQVSVKVGARSQPPVVQYRGNPPRIEVSLRPGEAPPPAPKPDSVPEKTAPPAAPKGKKGIKIRTVIVDPGHGGDDAGAINTSPRAREKDMVLSMGSKIKEALNAVVPGVNIVMTREDDRQVALNERRTIAHRKKGDLFISVHCNSIPGSLSKRASVKGFSVYFQDVAQDDESRAAALLENSAIRYERDGKEDETGSDIDYILKSTELNIYRNESEEFAILLEKEMSRRLSKVEKQNTGVSQAGFYVLRGVQMPAVLIETGFISNPREAGFLKRGDFQQELADAVAAAVRKFRDRYEEGD